MLTCDVERQETGSAAQETGSLALKFLQNGGRVYKWGRDFPWPLFWQNLFGVSCLVRTANAYLQGRPK